MPGNAKIVRACSTGYGEALLQAAFSLDDGEVETIAHCTAASFFDPKVDCVLDIGGQDMKCIRLKTVLWTVSCLTKPAPLAAVPLLKLCKLFRIYCRRVRTNRTICRTPG